MIMPEKCARNNWLESTWSYVNRFIPLATIFLVQGKLHTAPNELSLLLREYYTNTEAHTQPNSPSHSLPTARECFGSVIFFDVSQVYLYFHHTICIMWTIYVRKSLVPVLHVLLRFIIIITLRFSSGTFPLFWISPVIKKSKPFFQVDMRNIFTPRHSVCWFWLITYS